MDKILVEKLWSCNNVDSAYSESVWLEIISSLSAELEAFLECRIKDDDSPVINLDPQSPSFCSEIELLFSSHGPLAFNAKGVLGMQIVEGESGGDEINVDVFVFLYEGKHKLCTVNNESYIRFVYKKISDCEGLWSKAGWLEDEWGEFDSDA
jgi:hypothetical protein